MNECPSCRGQLDNESVFCPHCGNRVDPGIDNSSPPRPKRRTALITTVIAGIGILVGVMVMAAGGNSWISAKMGLSQGQAAKSFPVAQSTGGCCGATGQSGGGCGTGGGCGGGGCGSTGGNISDEEAYQAAEAVMSYWVNRHDPNDLKIEALNKGCHVELVVFLKETPLKAYKYVNGEITAI